MEKCLRYLLMLLIKDIVRLSLKALTDVVKTQGESLREMEK